MFEIWNAGPVVGLKYTVIVITLEYCSLAQPEAASAFLTNIVVSVRTLGSYVNELELAMSVQFESPGTADKLVVYCQV